MRKTKLIGIGAAAAAAGVLVGWLGWAAVTWERYGRVRGEPGHDPLLDLWMPAYEVNDIHEVRVAAPAALTQSVTVGTGLQRSAVVRAVIHARERLMRARGGSPWPSGGVVSQMRSSGWTVLAEVPDRAVVLGTVTQPWRGDVRFLALPPDEFLAFERPDYVKLAVAITTEPLGPDSSLLRVETRVATTDAGARARFRRYWAVFSPGIVLIRRAMLGAVKRDAERRQRGARGAGARSRLR